MRGQEALIAMRRQGIRPVAADISDGMDSLGCWRDWQHWTGTAHIDVQPEDRINRLDLRCVIGLFVVIAGRDSGRVQKLHDRCVEAGARGVMATVYAIKPNGDLQALERIETLGATA